MKRLDDPIDSTAQMDLEGFLHPIQREPNYGELALKIIGFIIVMLIALLFCSQGAGGQSIKPGTGTASVCGGLPDSQVTQEALWQWSGTAAAKEYAR